MVEKWAEKWISENQEYFQDLYVAQTQLEWIQTIEKRKKK